VIYLKEPEPIEGNTETRVYQHYTAEGLRRNYSYSDVGVYPGKYSLNGTKYWYTNLNTLKIYEYNSSWFYGSREDSMKYFIRNDSLYVGWSEFQLRGVRSEPLPADSIGG
jgi:hypothetical protein